MYAPKSPVIRVEHWNLVTTVLYHLNVLICTCSFFEHMHCSRGV